MPGRKAKSQGLPEAAGIEGLEKALRHTFARRELLERALIHRSWANEKGTPGYHNESMEFLGDAVLSLGVSRLLMERHGEQEVGDLARARAYLVSEANLAAKARALGLGSHMRLGRGEERGGGRDKDSLLADVYEAVLAAIYLDGGFDPVVDLIARQFSAQVARVGASRGAVHDHKTDLQEALQAVGLPVPKYRVAAESGPDHRKEFAVELLVGDRVVSKGAGTSKKTAEQEAARRAMRRVGRVIVDLLTGGDRAAGPGPAQDAAEPDAPPRPDPPPD